MKIDAAEISTRHRYKDSWLANFSYGLLKLLFGPIIRWLWVGEIQGIENIPMDGPVIVASNHESFLDPLCFIAISPRKIHYLTAGVFFNILLSKPFLFLTGQIEVGNNKFELLKKVLSALSQGKMIGIFPEGTRSPDGRLLKAYTGVARFALKAKVPVVPVGIIGTYEIMSRHDKFPRLKKAKIKIGKPIYFPEYYNIEQTSEHYRDAVDRIMLEIALLAGKEYSHARTHDKVLNA